MEIILIRHGKPTAANNPLLSASGYANWIRRYNASDIALNSRPEDEMIDCDPYYVISSDLKRAMHSTNIYTGQGPKTTSKLYREMEIPRYKIPFQFKAWTWVYLCRAFWMLGCKGSFESFSQAKDRAAQAADNLVELAQDKDKVVLFGHGYMNRYIRKSLIKKGWQLSRKSNHFWGVTKLESQ